MPPLLEAAKRRGLSIVWVLLSKCLYGETPIAQYQAAHDIAKPLASLRGTAAQDEVLTGICQKIRDAAGRAHGLPPA